jgi:hypothetical protein
MKIPATGFLRYQAAILELAQTYITPAYNAKKAGKPVAPADPSFWLLFTGFTEISNTLDALRLAELRPPSRICVDLAGLDVHLLRSSSSSKYRL